MVEIEQPKSTDKELRRYSRFLLPRDPVRLATKALLARDYAALTEPQKYLEALDNPFGPLFGRRMIAAEAVRLAPLTSEMAVEAERTLREIASYRHIPPVSDVFVRGLNIVCKYVVWYTVFYALAVTLVWLLPYGRDGGWGGFLAIAGVGLLMFFAIPVYSIVKDSTRYRRLRGLCASGLGRWGDSTSVEALMNLSEEGELWPPARESLHQVLKRLTPEDYGKVSPLAVRKLSDSFSKPRFPDELDEWVPLLLDSLEKIGTGSSVEGVQILARQGRKKEWQEHAQRILPLLLERQRLERDSSRLLRPTANGEEIGTLLRPASSTASEDEKLLRAANNEP